MEKELFATKNDNTQNDNKMSESYREPTRAIFVESDLRKFVGSPVGDTTCVSLCV